ncbi:dephospho-CoA kinase [Clostridium ganghwense]|uniref:Dephospho-CoA kinase n=1 Tax=Clostridium ganghwense TaxID=312089 RepID=A0ABT4CNX1_9CLOT|nr:dephospho-CoA kinase [Clostridium ganghwense]MCY6370762.1 dephospho-CoA kinase [Clostridium ganghwense]
MIKVGLTGGIGSGKSTVSKMLIQKNIPIVDADIISREVLDLYPETLEKIKYTFGKEFIDEGGSLKRRDLGNHIFKSNELRKKLENIVIPYIKREIFNRLEKYNELGEAICVVDAPTLIEHFIHKEMNANILVWVDRDIQIKRVMARDKLKEQEVLDRINSQMLLEDKRKEVNYIIDNSRELQYTKEQLENILTEIRLLGGNNEGEKKN